MNEQIHLLRDQRSAIGVTEVNSLRRLFVFFSKHGTEGKMIRLFVLHKLNSTAKK